MLNDYFNILTTRFASGEKLDLKAILQPIDDLDQDLTLIADLAASKGLCTQSSWRKAVAKERQHRRVVDALGSIPTTAMEYVDAFARSTATAISVDGLVKMMDPDDRRTMMRTTESHFLRLAQIRHDELDLGFIRASIQDAADEYLHRAKKRRRARLMTVLDHDPNVACDWRAIAQATCTDDPDYVAANIQHFIWQIKRKQKFLPIEHHLMVILGGAQDAGKSTFTKMIYSPIVELVRSGNFSMLTDERNIEIWSAAVIFMDEMAFASKSDADEVKNVITADTLDRRPMRSNSIDKVQQMATLIGTTNQVLGQIIRDTTGVRRFSYLNFRADPDYAVINAFDWEAAWRSVDENAAAPIIPFRKMLREAQEDARQRSTVEQWIDAIDAHEERELLDAQKAGAGTIRKERLFESYRRFCDDAAAQVRDKLDLSGFRNELKRLAQMNANPVFRPKATRVCNGFSYHGSVEPILEVVA